MALVVGLDIGAKTVKGAVVNGTPKKFRLVDFFIEDIPDMASHAGGAPSSETVDLETDLPVTVSEIVKKALADRGLQGAEIVASLDTKDCIIREIWVPFVKDEQIAKTLTFEAENYLITFDVEEMVLEYHKTDEVEGRSQLILLAARDRVVGDRLAMLKEGGVDPVALDLDSAALFNAFALTPTFDTERTTLLIDIGASTTKVLLIEDGTLKKVRAIRLGAFLGTYNPRQLPQPESAGEPEGGEGGRPVDFQIPDASSIEARFDEIENALRRLDPLASEPVLGSGQGPGGGDFLDLQEDDEPIAILTDDEFERVSAEDLEREGGTETVTEAPEGDSMATEAPSAPDIGDDEPPFAPAVSDRPTAIHISDEGVSELDYRQFLERLGLEIQRTFAVNFIRSPVELICLTGGMSHDEEARRYFSEDFDVETTPLDFGDSFDMDLDSEQRDKLNHVGAVAVGLAVKEQGQDRIGFDFRKQQFRYERRFEKLKYPLLLTGVMLCALFLQLVFDLISQYQFWGQRAQQVHVQAREYYNAFWGDLREENPGPRLAPATQELKSRLEEMLGKGGGDIPVILDPIEAVAEIGTVFREANAERIPFRIESIDLKLKTKPARTALGRRSGVDRNAPKIQPEGASRIIISTDEWNAGEELARLFDKNRMWQAAPSVSQSGGKVKVVLELTPKDDYLKTLQ